MIEAKIDREELALFEILKNPCLAAEFIYNMDRDERFDDDFEMTWYEDETLADFNSHVSMCTARAVGKTVTDVSLILWALAFNIFPNDYILFVVPSKVHLQPVWDGLMRGFRSNSFLSQFIRKNEGINASDNIIKCLNGAMLYCRIAGQSGTGANLVGLHTPFILVDEGGYFPWAAFQEMQPDLNVFTPGHREIVTGVPTGLREKNVLYTVDQVADNFTKHRVTAYDNPRNTPEDIENFKEQYGGEDSEDFIHYVLGQHGQPVFALFDRNLFEIKEYPVLRLEVDGTREEPVEIFTKLETFPPIKEKNYGILFGIDLGYTEPTAISILYVDENEKIKFHGRIKLTKVSYPIQEKILDLLAKKFQPFIIGMDEGQTGKSVRQHLLEEPQYNNSLYKEIFMPIDFSSWTIMGTDQDGNEVKMKTKPFTVSLLQDYTNNHRIVFSHTDPDMIIELERMTYIKNPNGEISYRTLTALGGKKGEDHFTSALLCGVAAYYFTREHNINKQRIRLLRPSWN